jgi:hypothetical protein
MWDTRCDATADMIARLLHSRDWDDHLSSSPLRLRMFKLSSCAPFSATPAPFFSESLEGGERSIYTGVPY